MELDGIWGGNTSYSGKALLIWTQEVAEVTIKLDKPRGRSAGQRVADSRVVLKTQSLRSLVTVWRRKL